MNTLEFDGLSSYTDYQMIIAWLLTFTHQSIGVRLSDDDLMNIWEFGGLFDCQDYWLFIGWISHVYCLLDDYSWIIQRLSIDY